MEIAMGKNIGVQMRIKRGHIHYHAEKKQHQVDHQQDNDRVI